MEVDGHRQRETDLDGGGDHRELVRVKIATRATNREGARGPSRAESGRSSSGGFRQQAQLQSKLRGARREAEDRGSVH